MNSLLRLYFMLGLTISILGCLSLPEQTQASTIRTLTAPEVKKMLDQKDTVLVHTLSSIEFEIQHIAGSINIPVIEMKTTQELPNDKNTPLIFYCMGVR